MRSYFLQERIKHLRGISFYMTLKEFLTPNMSLVCLWYIRPTIVMDSGISINDLILSYWHTREFSNLEHPNNCGLACGMDQTFNISYINIIWNYSSMKGSNPNMWTCGMNRLPHTTRDGHRQRHIFLKKIVDKLATNVIYRSHCRYAPTHNISF
jgi:hypothetical protein